jgi:hypothetical protein
MLPQEPGGSPAVEAQSRSDFPSSSGSRAMFECNRQFAIDGAATSAKKKSQIFD